MSPIANAAYSSSECRNKFTECLDLASEGWVVDVLHYGCPAASIVSAKCGDIARKVNNLGTISKIEANNAVARAVKLLELQPGAEILPSKAIEVILACAEGEKENRVKQRSYRAKK